MKTSKQFILILPWYGWFKMQWFSCQTHWPWRVVRGDQKMAWKSM